jgi:hypothetical protein
MKKFIALCFFATLFFSSCDENKNQPVPKTGTKKIVAVYFQDDGQAYLDVVLRLIEKKVRYDSVEKKDVIVYDTVYGYPKVVPITDSLNVQQTDSLGRPKTTIAYFPVKKESVIWNVAGLDIDSLIKSSSK